MVKIYVFLSLFLAYAGYSFLVYTKGTKSDLVISESEKEMIVLGKQIFQQRNCISCHQIYGLGGYLGTDLTTAYSDPARGEHFIRALLKAGGNSMPDFGFTDKEIEALMYYLKHIDSSADTYKKQDSYENHN